MASRLSSLVNAPLSLINESPRIGLIEGPLWFDADS